MQDEKEEKEEEEDERMDDEEDEATLVAVENGIILGVKIFSHENDMIRWIK